MEKDGRLFGLEREHISLGYWVKSEQETTAAAALSVGGAQPGPGAGGGGGGGTGGGGGGKHFFPRGPPWVPPGVLPSSSGVSTFTFNVSKSTQASGPSSTSAGL